jgi:succinate dehydrogenase/fumarate reductase-like Fe-S protein
MGNIKVKIERTSQSNKASNIDYFDVFSTDEDMTVLNVLEEIYYHHDPTVSFRFSCRTGLCSTCSMLINGKPALSCMKIAREGEDGFLALSPMPKGNTITDLIKEMK